MLCERIRSTQKWHNGLERRDCIFVEASAECMLHLCKSLHSSRSVATERNTLAQLSGGFPKLMTRRVSILVCGLFSDCGDEYDLIHLDRIVRAVHLMRIAGTITSIRV
jgi:hypothetical protein